MSEQIGKLYGEYVPDKYPYRFGCLTAGTRPSGVSAAWGYPTTGEDTKWATYDDGGHVLVEYKRWYGTYLGDTDTHEWRYVRVDGKVLLDRTD